MDLMIPLVSLPIRSIMCPLFSHRRTSRWLVESWGLRRNRVELIIRKGRQNAVLKKTDLDRFKKVLLESRKKIVGDLSHLEKDSLNLSQRDASGDLSGYSLHMADMATDNFDREFNLGLASSEQQILNQIDEALRRIEEGTYGTCEICEKPISQKRLVAVPYTKFCIKCQSEEEKKKRRS